MNQGKNWLHVVLCYLHLVSSTMQFLSIHSLEHKLIYRIQKHNLLLVKSSCKFEVVFICIQFFQKFCQELAVSIPDYGDVINILQDPHETFQYPSGLNWCRMVPITTPCTWRLQVPLHTKICVGMNFEIFKIY